MLRGTVRAMADLVPVIDLEPWRLGDAADRARVAAEVDDACRRIGFLQIVGHGVEVSVIDDMLSEARDEWTRATSSLVVAGLMQLPDEDPLEMDELDLSDDDLPEAPTEV